MELAYSLCNPAIRCPVALPDLTLLGYAERPPMLRLIRLANLTVEAAPASIDRGYALDDCLLRDGWIAFRPNDEVWGLPLPLGAEPFLVGEGMSWAAAAHAPRSIWLAEFPPVEPQVASEYDGVARAVVRRVEVPLGFRLAGEMGERRTGCRRRRGRRSRLGRRRRCAAASGRRRLALLRRVGSSLGVDPSRVPGARPRGRRRADRGRGPFPYRRAVGARRIVLAGRRSVGDRDRGLYRGVDRSRPHRLAIVDASDGSVALAEGEYDNFARPVWSSDGAWIVFNAPFEPGGLWLCAVAEPKLERILFESNPPVPLLDVSPFEGAW